MSEQIDEWIALFLTSWHFQTTVAQTSEVTTPNYPPMASYINVPFHVWQSWLAPHCWSILKVPHGSWIPCCTEHLTTNNAVFTETSAELYEKLLKLDVIVVLTSKHKHFIVLQYIYLKGDGVPFRIPSQLQQPPHIYTFTQSPIC